MTTTSSDQTIASTHPFRFWDLAGIILLPELRFKVVALVYGLAIALLSLALPVSVQVFVESVANTGQLDPVLAVSFILMVLLTGGAVFTALQIYAMDLFERRLFARIVSEIAMRLMYADMSSLEHFDRDDLLNRYFEIHTIRSALPPLVTGAIALLLQSVVGLAVVTFYHPFFFAFSILFGLTVIVVWRSLDKPAVRTAIASSYAKYDVADWLETLGRNNSFFKSRRAIDYALEETERQNAVFLERHRDHFHYVFSQTIGFLLAYVISSVTLLALAGWLVILGEMTLGQLVAAELILTGVFASMSRFGYYLELHYDVCAAMDKLSAFYRLPLEERDTDKRKLATDWSPSLELRQVRHSTPEKTFQVNASFPAGTSALVAAEDTMMIKLITDWLQRFREPDYGEVLVGGEDVSDLVAQDLRDDIAVIDSPLVLDGAIADYMALADPNVTRPRMREALTKVGFGPTLEQLPEGLETHLLPSGYPLYWTDTLQVKIAFAVLTRPKIMVLTPLIDSLTRDHRRQILQYINSLEGTTLIYFSNRRDLDLFDRYFTVHPTHQACFNTLDELRLSEGLPHYGMSEV